MHEEITSVQVYSDGWYRIVSVSALGYNDEHARTKYKFYDGEIYNTERKAKYEYSGMVYSGKTLLDLNLENPDLFFDKKKHKIETRDFSKTNR